MREAEYYEKRPDGKVACKMCPHFCVIAPGEVGKCRVRRSEDGVLYSLIYGEVTSVALDPVEKKPLYHFHPGEQILSLGTWGCNFHCEFCQNWQISQGTVTTEKLPPEAAVEMARREGSVGIAYTYNEPSIWAEYVRDTAKAAKEAGLVNVLVTNGFWNPAPLEDVLVYTDALNIDIKAMSEEFYREMTGGRLAPVLAAAVQANRRAHVEVTNLVIPGKNDKAEEFEALGKWVAENLGEETPCHLSSYFPRFRLKIEPTPAETLERGAGIVRQFLKHVYLGNVGGESGHDTQCAACGNLLIRRMGYNVRVVGLKGSACVQCGHRLKGEFRVSG